MQAVGLRHALPVPRNWQRMTQVKHGMTGGFANLHFDAARHDLEASVSNAVTPICAGGTCIAKRAQKPR
jgi:hypothetical protein